MTIDRRRFLQTTAAAGLALAGPFGAWSASAASVDPGRGRGGASTVGYGPLKPRRAQNDGVVYLALPAGFTYYAFGHVGSAMSNGQATPAAHDGMAAYPGPGRQVVLVRNHEQNVGPAFTTPAYDAGAAGGTTTILFDPDDPASPEVLPSLSGTVRNCAGGATPWGTWLTCEETTSTVGVIPHGYVFEVPAELGATGDAVPYKRMGRLSHEAVAVDPGTWYVYETEDAGESGFYRFVPTCVAGPRPDLTDGALFILKVAGEPNANMASGRAIGDSYAVEWEQIDAAAVDAPSVGGFSAPYTNGKTKGAAFFRRLEGTWWSDDDDAVYFNSTDGGEADAGQVWAYRPADETLTLVYESPAFATLFKPDNITITRRGGVLLCEDTDNARQTYLKGLSAQGILFDFARNEREGVKPGTSTPARNDEFAGATFSPDGKWLFVNIQTPGVTFAIRGPWARGEL